jgi:hypothetical protein
MCLHSNVRSDVTVDNRWYVDFAFLLKITPKMTFCTSAHIFRGLLCVLREKPTPEKKGRFLDILRNYVTYISFLLSSY